MPSLQSIPNPSIVKKPVQQRFLLYTVLTDKATTVVCFDQQEGSFLMFYPSASAGGSAFSLHEAGRLFITKSCSVYRAEKSS